MEHYYAGKIEVIVLEDLLKKTKEIKFCDGFLIPEFDKKCQLKGYQISYNNIGINVEFTIEFNNLTSNIQINGIKYFEEIELDNGAKICAETSKTELEPFEYADDDGMIQYAEQHGEKDYKFFIYY